MSTSLPKSSNNQHVGNARSSLSSKLQISGNSSHSIGLSVNKSPVQALDQATSILSMNVIASRSRTSSDAQSDSERLTAIAIVRAEAAENRLMRCMAKFSALVSQLSSITAARQGSAIIAAVESRNELAEQSPWPEFAASSPTQYLRAILSPRTEIAELIRIQSQFEIGIPLMEGGSLGLKLLPNLTISRVQRNDLDCQEGDRILSVDSIAVHSIEDLREALRGKQEVTVAVETGGALLLTIEDASLPYWEVKSVPQTTSTRKGQICPGDLVLQINGESVAGLSPRKVLGCDAVRIGFLPGKARLAQRIKRDGLMSFATKVETTTAKDGSARYNIVATKFQPDMYAGIYTASILLGSHQIGNSFTIEIEEGPADAFQSQISLSGPWQTMAGHAFQFKIIGFDSARNAKHHGGCRVSVKDAEVKDEENGSYGVKWRKEALGKFKISVAINDEIKIGIPECEVLAAETEPLASQLEIRSINPAINITGRSDGVDYTIVAGTHLAIAVKLFDRFGNVRPKGKDKVTISQISQVFQNETLDSEILLLPVGNGCYEYQGLAIHACTKSFEGAIQTSGLHFLVNECQAKTVATIIDVLPAEVNLERCLATIPPSGLYAKAGESFEFDVIVRDGFGNLRNRTTDKIELREFLPKSKLPGDVWGEFEVVAGGQGSYRITSRQTVARQSFFTYLINGACSSKAGQVYSMNISPNEVNVGQCIVTGDTKTTVSNHISQLISLRDEYGNVLSSSQIGSIEVSMCDLKVLKSDFRPEELNFSSRISRIDTRQGLCYTHQMVCTTNQSVQLSLKLVVKKQLLQHLDLIFEAGEVDEHNCSVEDFPQIVRAGESMSMKIILRDSFNNGLSGLEPTIKVLPEDCSQSSMVMKVSGRELGQGNYIISAKIFKSTKHFNVLVQAGSKVLLKSSIEVLPSIAHAKRSEIECPSKSLAHFPVQARLTLRDEFGNLALATFDQFSVEISGCCLTAQDVYTFCEPNGTFLVILLPRTCGELSLRVSVEGKPLMEGAAIIQVHGVSHWTKENARDWIMIVAQTEPRLQKVVSVLGETFVKQIAAGLLDRGALHFAFGVDDLRTAQYLAACIANLSREPTAPVSPLPMDWTSSGSPPQSIVLSTDEDDYAAIARRLCSLLPSLSILRVERREDAALYQRYASWRTVLAHVQGDKVGAGPCERLLWHAATPARLGEYLELGFSAERLLGPAGVPYKTLCEVAGSGSSLALGLGYYFAADPRLANWWNSRLEPKEADIQPTRATGRAADATGGIRCLILARVACGVIAAAQVDPVQKLARKLGQSAASWHTVTGPARVELVTGLGSDAVAYPAYLVHYRLAEEAADTEGIGLLSAEPREGLDLAKIDECGPSLVG